MLKLPQWELDWFERNEKYLIKPNWEIELQLAVVHIDAFAAMTIGCAWDEDSHEIALPCNLTVKGRESVESLYNDRVRILENNSSGGFPRCYHNESNHYCRLKEATKWVYDKGWELPKPMLRLINQEKKIKAASPDMLSTSHPKWRKAYEYESEGLDAFYDLIEKHFFDSKGRPIYKSNKWPLKKNISSGFLSKRTIEEADTIITSGKRKGRAIKK